MKKCMFSLILALSLAVGAENYQQAADRFTRDMFARPKAWESYRGRAQAYLGLGRPR